MTAARAAEVTIMSYEAKSRGADWSRWFPLIEQDKAGDVYAIESRAINLDHLTGSVQAVVFERWNDVAKVSEEVTVAWQKAFKWADSDPCGGHVVGVFVGNNHGRMNQQFIQAKSYWFNPRYDRTPIGSNGERKHSLVSINIDGSSGGPVLVRDYDVRREVANKAAEAARLGVTEIARLQTAQVFDEPKPSWLAEVPAAARTTGSAEPALAGEDEDQEEQRGQGR
jgi:hypothetical protein